MKKRIKTIILSIFLIISIFSLSAIPLYNHFNTSKEKTTVVPSNLVSAKSDYISEKFSNQDSEQENIVENSISFAAPVNNQSQVNADVLYLHSKSESDNSPFQVENMFPGDKITKYYCVRVSHNNTVTVRYHADIKNGYEKLSEVLKCKVVLLTTGEALYDGLMKDMPKSLDYKIDTDSSVVSEAYYEITVYLDTSVGNDYQLQGLSADFRWWVEEIGNLDAPETGDENSVKILVALVAMSGSMLLLIILLSKKERRRIIK